MNPNTNQPGAIGRSAGLSLIEIRHDSHPQAAMVTTAAEYAFEHKHDQAAQAAVLELLTGSNVVRDVNRTTLRMLRRLSYGQASEVRQFLVRGVQS